MQQIINGKNSEKSIINIKLIEVSLNSSVEINFKILISLTGVFCYKIIPKNIIIIKDIETFLENYQEKAYIYLGDNVMILSDEGFIKIEANMTTSFHLFDSSILLIEKFRRLVDDIKNKIIKSEY